jgi:hypothetical protein
VLDVSRKELWHLSSEEFVAEYDVLVNKQQIENALKPYGLIRNHSQKYQTSKKSTNQKDNTKSLVQF